MRRSSDRLILSGWLLLPEALSFEFNAVGVVDEAIEDCVGHGGVADDFVPAVDGQLAGDNDRASFISVLDNLKQITALVGDQGASPLPARLESSRSVLELKNRRQRKTWNINDLARSYFCLRYPGRDEKR